MQLDRQLLQQPVALAQVARRAGGDDVLPRRVAAARARDDVVERQPAAGRAAVDAAPAVTGKQGAAGDLPLHHPGHAHVVHEPDDVGPSIGVARGAEWSVQLLDDFSLPLVDEHVRAAQRAHIERLVTRIENENLLHRGRRVPAKEAIEVVSKSCQRPIARSTASCSSGESATAAFPRSSSLM